LSDYLNQKAVEFDKQGAKWRKEHTLDELSATHIAQAKYDGCQLIIDTKNMIAVGRDGKGKASVDHIIHECAKVFGPDLVIWGEVYEPGSDFYTINGAFNRKSAQSHLWFVPYDMVASFEFDEGYSDVPYKDRKVLIDACMLHRHNTISQLIDVREYSPGTYVKPLQLAKQLVSQGGFDGLILRDPQATWRRGTSKEGELIKVKPSDNLDLRCVGVQTGVGEKTGRPVYTIDVDYKGVTTRVGSGVPHDIKDVPKKGCIVEIECMAVNPSNTLREPRFIGIKFDKDKPDA